MSQRRTEFLQGALAGLSEDEDYLLSAAAAFHYPVEFKALHALNPYTGASAAKQLNAALNNLEDRGLLLWDRATNRYDLHPVVRAYAFERLQGERRAEVFARIRDHFSGQPKEDPAQVNEVDDLRRSLEIYHAFVGAGLLDEAASFYRNTLSNVLLLELNAYRRILELLAPLFPDGFGALPQLSTPRDQGYFANDVSVALLYLGRDDEALVAQALLFRIDLNAQDAVNLQVSLNNYSVSLANLNHLAAADRCDKLALRLAQTLGSQDAIARAQFYVLADARQCGDWGAAEAAYRAFQDAPPRFHFQATQYRAWVALEYALLTIQRGEDGRARLDEAERLAGAARDRSELARIAEWRGEDALIRGDWATAAKYSNDAFADSRKMGSPSTRVLLRGAFCAAKLGNAAAARDGLEKAALRPDTPRSTEQPALINAAEVYHALGDTAQAKAYLAPAYKWAWAEGTPYMNWWVLERCRKLIATLGMDEAALQKQMGCMPFDSSKVEKIPYEDEIMMFILKREVE